MTSAPSQVLGQERAVLRAFLELPVAVGVLDRDLRFIAINEALSAMNGLPVEEHLGRRGPEILPEVDAGAWEAFRSVIETGASSIVLVRGRTHASSVDGAWQEELHPWRDPETGEILGVITTVIDVSAQQRTEEATRRQQERLGRLAMLGAELVNVADQVDVAELLCRHAARALEATAAAVATGRTGEPVHVIAAAGYPDMSEEGLARLANGTALGDTARTGSSHVFIEGPEWEARFPHGAAFHRDLGLRAVATVPLLSSDETIGALAVSYSEARPFTEDDAATLATLASIGGQAMERARAGEERARAAALRDAFIDVMAHELKTPLATIYGGLQTVAQHEATLAPHLRAELLADATEEAHRLVRLVDNLVVLSRLERGVSVDLSEPLMVSHVTRAVIETKVLTQGVPIALSVPSGIPPVCGEGAYVEQVLRNFMTNAIKYGKPPYEVTVEMAGEEVQVRVLDRGRGVPADAEKLFALYYRDPSDARRASGSGIGLFVCRELVRLMGGRTWARNRDDGGAEFGFSLPVWTDDEP